MGAYLHIGFIWTLSLFAPLAHATLMKRPYLPYFIFWALGVRFALAGLLQFFKPSVTGTKIFNMDENTIEKAKPLLKEFGLTNLVGGTLACLSLWYPSFRCCGL